MEDEKTLKERQKALDKLIEKNPNIETLLLVFDLKIIIEPKPKNIKDEH